MTEVYGGKLADIPKPHRRLYRDQGEKRPVTIELSSWCQIGSIGAKHLYVKITEEDDPIWNEKKKCWQRAWDDVEGRGRVIECHDQFIYEKDEAAAGRWVKRQLAKHFPRKTHVYKYEDGGLSRRVRRLAREGD